MDDGPSRRNNNNNNNLNNNHKSFLETLKSEWSLLWHSLLDETSPPERLQEKDFSQKISTLGMEPLKNLSKGVSLEKKHLHLKHEQLQKDIRNHQDRLETLQLVRGETEELLRKIDSLSSQGQMYTEALQKLDEQLKSIRNREMELLQIPSVSTGVGPMRI